uniref:Uncharacterized protein n=1 Tax=Anguilla anguilla TaxID=7936 RepID=A0A0E9V6H6_ANGAN
MILLPFDVRMSNAALQICNVAESHIGRS